MQTEDAKITSALAPDWMQIRAKRPKANSNIEKYFKKRGSEDIKNIHSFMHTRHQVLTKEEAEQSNSKANQCGSYRLYQWDEDESKQGYDRVLITGKIGTNY